MNSLVLIKYAIVHSSEKPAQQAGLDNVNDVELFAVGITEGVSFIMHCHYQPKCSLVTLCHFHWNDR